MKTGFSPSEVGGIAFCDHKMSSASSLSPYQAVCCTKLTPLAWGTGHTSSHHHHPFLHPHPNPSPLFLSFRSVFRCLFTTAQWPTLFPHNPPSPRCRPQALGFHSVSAHWRPQCWQSKQAFRGHIKPRPSSTLLGTSAHNKRTGTPVSLRVHY